MPLPRSITRRHCQAALAALSAAAGVRVRAAAHDWRALQDTLDTFVRERNGPGVAVAIRYGDDAPSYLSAGTIAFDSAERFDADSLCRIYSMTKHVTRIATLLLVEDGTITLDTPVTEILPEFKKLRVAIDIERGLEARPATRTMTVRHLITNTSGLGNWTPSSDSGEELHALYRQRGVTPGSFGAMRARPGYGPQPTSLDELVARVADLPLAYEPGTRLHYSIGFDVMALVIQRAARMPYGEFLERRLFGPLAMASTGFQVKAKDAARLTTNYDATPRGDNATARRRAGSQAAAGVACGRRSHDQRLAEAASLRRWGRRPGLDRARRPALRRDAGERRGLRRGAGHEGRNREARHRQHPPARRRRSE
jgi:CubicO group peptidase (beta-lactamase class C family)